MNIYTLNGTIRTVTIRTGTFSIPVQATDFGSAEVALDPADAAAAASWEPEDSTTSTVLRSITLDDDTICDETGDDETGDTKTITFEVQDTVLPPVYSAIEQNADGGPYSPMGVERVNTVPIAY